MRDVSITVLLATYNGEKFLDHQLESLWSQSTQDFVVVVRDDGSTDATRAILERHMLRRPDRLAVLPDDGQRNGAKGSFSKLLAAVTTDYAAFCDQDDEWLPDKLAKSLLAVQKAELSGGKRPMLCCGDAAVTDAHLRVVGASFWQRHNIDVASGRDLAPERVVFRNFAIGATTFVNRALIDLCRDIPPAAVMHDWWCALVAATFGKVLVLDEPLIRYRQHGANAIGSKTRAFPLTPGAVFEYLSWARTTSAACVGQLEAFVQAYGSDNGMPMPSGLRELAKLRVQSAPRRISTLLGARAYKPGLALNALHLYACATAKF